jgi:hypothetical protein
MAIQLIDEGTLDTVFECSECRKTFRRNFVESGFGEDLTLSDSEAYEAFTEYELREIESEHSCSDSENDMV